MSIFKLLSSLKRLVFPIIVKGKWNKVSIKTKKRGKFFIRINGNNNEVVIEDDVLLYDFNLTITGDNNIVRISKRSRIYDLMLSMSGCGCSFIFGENAGVRQANIVIWENQSVIIEDDAMLSYGINIRTSDSHSIYDGKTDERINIAKSVYIRKHAWLGQNVTLLKGADIGEGTVVGFGSICSKEYPSNCIVAGCPGKIIKRNIKWDRKLT